MIRPFVFLFTSFITLPALAQQFTGDEADIQAIQRAAAAFSRFYVNADYEAMANAYTENGHILPNGSPIITGRDSIIERWQLPEGVRILEHATESVELKVLDDYAYDLGYYRGRTRRPDGSEAEWGGKYVIVWRKLDGEWLMHVDMWDSWE
ncbi:MAG: nuclear transport factor 2 family protein [Lewinella sp.]